MKIEAGAAFTQAEAKFKNRLAARDSNGQNRTYTMLKKRANRLGSALRELGIAQGDRVAVLSYNRIEVLESWLALERFNMVRVVMHTHFETEVHVRTLGDVGARVLIFDAAFAGRLADVRAKMSTVGRFICIGDTCPDWADRFEYVLAGGTDADPRLDVDEDAACFLQLTSGTTGQPKPWIHTHRSFRAVIADNLEHLDAFAPGSRAIDESDVNFHFHALQWATGFQTLMPYLLRGALSVIVDDSVFVPDVLVDQIVESGATGMLVPGPMLPPLLDQLEIRGLTAPNLRRLVIFFATPELLKRTSRVLGECWCHGYGSSEQGAPVTRLSWAEVAGSEARLGSVGRIPSSFCEVQVVDETGRRLPTGAVGEIVVRSPMSTGGYWGLPEKTAECFFPGGWFRANDVGFIDGDGFIYYLDRAKDRIVTAAGVVYPHVVESSLLRHQAVANCGVVGLGEPGRQAVVAAILLKGSASGTDALAADIKALTIDLPAHQQPQAVVFVAELPTVLGGAKVQREALQQRLSASVLAIAS